MFDIVPYMCATLIQSALFCTVLSLIYISCINVISSTVLYMQNEINYTSKKEMNALKLERDNAGLKNSLLL